MSDGRWKERDENEARRWVECKDVTWSSRDVIHCLSQTQACHTSGFSFKCTLIKPRSRFVFEYLLLYSALRIFAFSALPTCFLFPRNCRWNSQSVLATSSDPKTMVHDVLYNRLVLTLARLALFDNWCAVQFKFEKFVISIWDIEWGAS